MGELHSVESNHSSFEEAARLDPWASSMIVDLVYVRSGMQI